MELHSHLTCDFLYVDNMMDDVSGRINFGVGIMVDIGGELCKLAIEQLPPMLVCEQDGGRSCWGPIHQYFLCG